MSAPTETVGGGIAPLLTAGKAQGAMAGEPTWLSELRANAADLAARMSFPQPSRERPWKYLDVTGLSFDGYALSAPTEAAQAPADLMARLGIAADASAVLIQNDGTTLLTKPGTGIALTDFAAASVAAQATIKKYLGQRVPAGRSRFTALHYACMTGGVLIEAAAGAETAHPVHIVRNYGTAKQFAAPHTLIVTGENSHITVIEDYRSNDEDIVVVPVVEVVPGPGSSIRYVTLHRWGAETRVFSEQNVVTERDAAFVGFNVVTGGRVVKSHLHSALEGRGSSSELFGVYVGDDHQHVDFYTVQDHIGADTRSDLLFKSALKDSARSVYYGLTRVGLGAKNADANQENRNLLLSKSAKADSDPVLEILTNDVIRVSHGATAGPVDEEQLYYLQARGIHRADAEGLLVHAFLGQVLDRVPDEALRAELEIVLEAKLGTGR